MYCSERERLVARYEAATRTYSIAVQALSDKRSHEFRVAYAETERMRQVCEHARIALDRHSIEHGCGQSRVSVRD